MQPIKHTYRVEYVIHLEGHNQRLTVKATSMTQAVAAANEQVRDRATGYIGKDRLGGGVAGEEVHYEIFQIQRLGA